MFERFSEKARQVILLSQKEARTRDHDHIGTEHILLGLIHEGQGTGVKALVTLGVSPDTVRERVDEIIGRGEQPPGSAHIPFTAQAKKVLELALRETLNLGHNYIGTEHILLGLIRERDGVAAQVLGDLGVDYDRTREQVTTLLQAWLEEHRPMASGSIEVGVISARLASFAARLTVIEQRLRDTRAAPGG